MLGGFANQKLGAHMYHVPPQLKKISLIVEVRDTYLCSKYMVSIYFVNQLLAAKNVSLSCYRDVSIVEKGLCRV